MLFRVDVNIVFKDKPQLARKRRKEREFHMRKQPRKGRDHCTLKPLQILFSKGIFLEVIDFKKNMNNQGSLARKTKIKNQNQFKGGRKRSSLLLITKDKREGRVSCIVLLLLKHKSANTQNNFYLMGKNRRSSKTIEEMLRSSE